MSERVSSPLVVDNSLSGAYGRCYRDRETGEFVFMAYARPYPIGWSVYRCVRDDRFWHPVVEGLKSVSDVDRWVADEIGSYANHALLVAVNHNPITTRIENVGWLSWQAMGALARSVRPGCRLVAKNAGGRFYQ